MASNHTEQQHNAQNVTFMLGSGNRGRPVAKIKIVPLRNQTASDERVKAEQLQKEKLKQQQGVCIVMFGSKVSVIFCVW